MKKNKIFIVTIFFFLFIGNNVLPVVADDEFDFFHLPKVRMMSWNVYIGTDVFAALADPPDSIIAGINEVIASNMPARAKAIARQIKLIRPQPHVLCLQEAWKVTIPGQPELDFKELILNELGTDYIHVVTNVLTSVTIPIGPGAYLTVEDRDVIIAHEDVEVIDTETMIFANLLPVPLPPPNVLFSVRGLAKARLRIDGYDYLIGNTHLELFSPIKELQAQEVVDAFAGEAEPVILAGDFNDEPGTYVYSIVTNGGFKDMYEGRLLGRSDPGYTCCQQQDLLNYSSILDERIDYIFARNQDDDSGPTVAATLLGLVVGDRQLNKTFSTPRLWPSDHGGLYTILLIPSVD